MITFTRDWRGYAKGSSVGTLEATMEALAVAEGAAAYGGVAGPLNSYLGRTNAVQAQVDEGGNALPPTSVTVNSRDGMGRATSYTIGTTTFTVTYGTNGVATVSGAGKITTYTYNASGLLTSVATA